MSAPAPVRSTGSPPPVARLAVPAVLLLGMVVKTLAPVHDPDTWWHLRSGAELARTWVFDGPDPWGTFATREWIRHQWLADLAFGAADRLGGLPAVAWLLPAMTAFVVVALYSVSRRRAGLLVTCLVVVVAYLAMSGSLSLRPQVLSFGFTAVTAGAWLATVEDGRMRWWLVPLTWVWASCHGLWVVGPAIGAAVVAGMALARDSRRSAVRTLWIPLASVAAAAVTPVGPRLLWAPFQVRDVTPYLQEWQRSSLTDPPFIAGVALLLLVGGGWGLARRRPHPAHALVLLLAVVLVLVSRRTVGIGSCVAAPLTAAALQSLLPLAREVFGRLEARVAAVGALLGMVVAAFLAPAVASRPDGVPEGLTFRLAGLPAGTVVCNSYDAGSWLLWRLPELRPVIDGRTELYTPAQVEAHLAFVAGDPSWRAYVAARDCTAALLRSSAPVVPTLEVGGWRRAGTDSDWVLLEPPP